MTKQRPDPDKLVNELTGASSFFKRSEVTRPVATDPAAATGEPPVSGMAASPRSPVRPDRPRKRQMIRHGFEIYLDQLEQLRDLAAAQRDLGELGSMSKMVRDALDRLLAEHDD
jgi:hypothetical protein